MTNFSIQWVKSPKNGPVTLLSDTSVLIKGAYSNNRETCTPMSAKMSTFVSYIK